MFPESREKLRRLRKVKERPRTFLLQKRGKHERMNGELRRDLLKMEKKLPIVKTYDSDDYFPADQVVRGVSKSVNFLVNAFFTFLALLLIALALLTMGPSRVMAESLVNPMIEFLEPCMMVSDFDTLDKLARTALNNDIFALG